MLDRLLATGPASPRLVALTVVVALDVPGRPVDVDELCDECGEPLDDDAVDVVVEKPAADTPGHTVRLCSGCDDDSIDDEPDWSEVYADRMADRADRHGW